MELHHCLKVSYMLNICYSLRAFYKPKSNKNTYRSFRNVNSVLELNNYFDVNVNIKKTLTSHCGRNLSVCKIMSL